MPRLTEHEKSLVRHAGFFAWDPPLAWESILYNLIPPDRHRPPFATTGELATVEESRRSYHLIDLYQRWRSLRKARKTRIARDNGWRREAIW